MNRSAAPQPSKSMSTTSPSWGRFWPGAPSFSRTSCGNYPAPISGNKRTTTRAMFVSRNGNPLNRSNIRRDMKVLCESAGVDPDKVFPHNLRHLFARTYYSLEHGLSRLADILDHAKVRLHRRERQRSSPADRAIKPWRHIGFVLLRPDDLYIRLCRIWVGSVSTIKPLEIWARKNRRTAF